MLSFIKQLFPRKFPKFKWQPLDLIHNDVLNNSKLHSFEN